MANKCIMYTALVVVCLGIGAIIGGLATLAITGCHYDPAFSGPFIQKREAQCNLITHNTAEQRIVGQLNISQQTNEHITIRGTVSGLPIGLHGFHIHATGVSGYDCTSSGGHYNPYEVDHAGPTNETRHVGDLGNIDVTTENNFAIRITDQMASLFGKDSIVGRAIVIHEGEDDLVSQPTGNAGGRLACCTIMPAP